MRIGDHRATLWEGPSDPNGSAAGPSSLPPVRTGRNGRPILTIKAGGGGKVQDLDGSGPMRPTAIINRNIPRARGAGSKVRRAGQPAVLDATNAPKGIQSVSAGSRNFASSSTRETSLCREGTA